MAKVSISLPDELVSYIHQKVENPSALIENLLKQWRHQQEDTALAVACSLMDELELGWESEWQNAAITNWETLDCNTNLKIDCDK
ncbi:hypothetical protein IQ276_023675 [Desmonostoc muscorum LEGE 12446]|uniref:Uncharacterized protein n=1 Tax=Desmonostoc muscorum LEGE 12446 TaxID=1828758 RepID=A0A8J7ACV4_DESMC|nr:hypothetical protein [Desmonostoc muscorum]MCF2149375.1 hypothetical protein [Desmonostoc muscorum LEGE 12446]